MNCRNSNNRSTCNPATNITTATQKQIVSKAQNSPSPTVSISRCSSSNNSTLISRPPRRTTEEALRPLLTPAKRRSNPLSPATERNLRVDEAGLRRRIFTTSHRRRRIRMTSPVKTLALAYSSLRVKLSSTKICHRPTSNRSALTNSANSSAKCHKVQINLKCKFGFHLFNPSCLVIDHILIFFPIIVN